MFLCLASFTRHFKNIFPCICAWLQFTHFQCRIKYKSACMNIAQFYFSIKVPNSQTVFQSSCSILLFHQQSMSVPTSKRFYQRLLLFVFIINCRHHDGYEVIVHCGFNFISISLIYDAEQLQAICVSLENHLFRSFAHFFNEIIFPFIIEL